MSRSRIDWRLCSSTPLRPPRPTGRAGLSGGPRAGAPPEVTPPAEPGRIHERRSLRAGLTEDMAEPEDTGADGVGGDRPDRPMTCAVLEGGILGSTRPQAPAH